GRVQAPRLLLAVKDPAVPGRAGRIEARPAYAVRPFEHEAVVGPLDRRITGRDPLAVGVAPRAQRFDVETDPTRRPHDSVAEAHSRPPVPHRQLGFDLHVLD